MRKRSSTIKWFNYGIALSVLLINTGFLLPVTIREINTLVLPPTDNTVLQATFNCNLLMIPAIISLFKGYAYYAGWLVANSISLLICIYVYFLLVVTVNAI